MPKIAEYELGTYTGRRYFLVVTVWPDRHNVEDFAVVLHYRDTKTLENVQIARIDTEHGQTHFDRLFEEGVPKEPFDGDVWDAWEYLATHWQKYARRYEQQR